MVYVKQTRPRMVAENPKMTVREIVSNLAKTWREMDEISKKPYEEVAIKDKQRADDERAAWVAAGKEIPKRRKKQKRKHKKHKVGAEKKVKRVSSAYIFFSMAQRPNIALANPGWQMGDVSKELGRRWRVMTDEEKGPYIQKHEEDKERHRIEREKEQREQRIEHEKQQAQLVRDMEAAQVAGANCHPAQLAQQQMALQQHQQFTQAQLQQLQQLQMAQQAQAVHHSSSLAAQQQVMQQHAQQAAIQQQLQMQMQHFQQAQMAQQMAAMQNQ